MSVTNIITYFLSYLITSSDNHWISNIFWTISNLQLVSLITSLSFNHNPEISVPVIETFFKLSIIDCSQIDLARAFPFLLILTLTYLLFLLSFNIIVFNSIRKHSLSTRLATLFEHTVSGHIDLLYIPCTNILSAFLLANSNGNLKTLWPYGFENAQYLIVLVSIGLGLNFLFGFLYSVFNYSISIDNKKARVPSLLDFCSIVIKSAYFLTFIRQHVSGNNGYWAIMFVLLIVESYCVFIILYDSPYFNQTQKSFLLGCKAWIVAILSNAILYEWIPPGSFSPVYVWAFLFGGLYNVLNYISRVSPEKILAKSNLDAKSVYSFKIISYFHEMMTKVDVSLMGDGNIKGLDYLVFINLISSHSQTCLNKSCFCKLYGAEKTLINSTDIKLSFFDFKDSLLKQIWKLQIQNEPENPWLRISFADYLISKNESQFPQALLYLNTIKPSQKNSFVSNSVDRIQKKIKIYANKISSNEALDVDIVRFIEYKDHASLLTAKIIENSKKTCEFWQAYEVYTPMVLDLCEKAHAINRLDDRIKADWNFLVQKYKSLLSEEYLFFAAYILVTKCSENLGIEALKNYQARIQSFLGQKEERNFINNSTVIESDNLILTYSMEKNRLGKIIDVKGNSDSALGISHADLKTCTINNILPHFIREHHDGFLMNHIENGTQGIMYKNLKLYVAKKIGCLLPAQIYICPSPKIDISFDYMVIIRPIKRHAEFILYSEDGIIEGYSDKIGENLKLSEEHIGTMNITQLCPKFLKMHRLMISYEWILNNTTLAEQDHFLVIKKKLDQHNEKNASEYLLVPKSEKEYEDMRGSYDQIVNDGWPLEFFDGEESFKFFCKNTNLEIYSLKKIRILTLKRIHSRSHITKDKIKTNLIKDSDETVLNVKITDYRLTTTDTNLGNGPSSLIMQTKPESRLLRFKNSPRDTIYSESDYGSPAFRHRKYSIEISADSNSIARHSQKQRDNMTHFSPYRKNRSLIVEDKDNPNGKEINLESISEDYLSNDNNRNEVFLRLINMSRKTTGYNISAATGKTSVSVSLAKKIERAINVHTGNDGHKILKIFMLLFYLGVIIAVFYFTFFSEDNINSINKTLAGLNAASSRHVTLLLFNQAARKMDILNEELILEPWEDYFEDLRNDTLRRMKEYITSISEYTPIMLQTIAIMHSDDVKEIQEDIEMVPVVDGQDPVYIPLDQAISLLENAGLSVINNQNEFAEENMDTIIYNIPDSILAKSETIPEVYLHHLEEIFDLIEGYLQNLVIAQSVISVFIFLYFIILEREQRLYRRRFLEIFVKIDDKHWRPHIEEVKMFRDLAIDSKEELSISQSKFFRSNKPTTSHTPLNKKKDSSMEQFSRRRPKFAKIHLGSYIRTLWQAIILLILIIASTVYFLVESKQIDRIIKSCHNLVLNNHVEAENVLLVSILDNYILEGSTKLLRGRSVYEELWNDIDYVKKNQKYYLELTNDGEVDPAIMEVVKADICSRYETYITQVQKEPIEECYQIGRGGLKYGLNAMSSYLLQSVQELLLAFDSKTDEETYVKNLPKTSYYELNLLVQNVIFLPYGEIGTIITRKTSDLSGTNEIMIWSANILYLLIAFVLAGVSRVMALRVENERFETKRMLNLIPLSIILETSTLKAYLSKEAKILL